MCGRNILTGAEYVYECQKFNGEILQMRRHIHCDAMLEAYFDAEQPDEYGESEVHEWVCDRSCNGCPHADSGDCEAAGTDAVWGCAFAQRAILPRSVQAAAKRSVLENDEDLQR